MVIAHLLLLIVGFALLVKGSDFLIEASSRIAKRLGVSEFIIGLTLVAVGTSIPELFTSIVAVITKNTDIIIGNIIGSNIANIGLILGISAIIGTISIKKSMIVRDGHILMAIGLIFYVLIFNRTIASPEGIVFLIIYLSYIMFLFSSKETKKIYDFKDFLNYTLKFKYLKTIKNETIKTIFKRKKEATAKEKKEFFHFKQGLIKDMLIVIISIIAIIYGAKYLITEAVWFAEFIGISTTAIGITVVALGTSLPELSVAIRAARKGLGDMIIGNVIGSNISNILLILGITSIIKTLSIPRTTLLFSIPFLIIQSLLLLAFMKTKSKITKTEGISLLITYLVFILLIFCFGLS